MSHHCEGGALDALKRLNQTVPLLYPFLAPEAKGAALLMWYRLVKTNAPLDFKKDQAQAWGWDNAAGDLVLAGVPVRGDVLANLYYGYAGREAGFPSWLLQAGAGFYNGYEYARRQIPNWNGLSWPQRIKQLWDKWPWKWWQTWFDDPEDNAAIRAGMMLYEQYTTRGRAIDEAALQEVLEAYGLHQQGDEGHE